MYWSAVTGDKTFETSVKQVNEKYGISFKRPSQLPKKEGGSKTPSLWGDKGVLPLAINQGSIGDCWYLSSLSAIAETPSRIKTLFENKEYPKDGAFQVYFWIGGKKQKVIIDDRLPVVDEYHKKGYVSKFDELYASKVSPQGAWWGVIMEKAAAKLFANYAGTESGVA